VLEPRGVVALRLVVAINVAALVALVAGVWDLSRIADCATVMTGKNMLSSKLMKSGDLFFISHSLWLIKN